MLSIFLQEGGEPLFLYIHRTGGDLVTKSILFTIEPNGRDEFYGATDILVFGPGETEKNATIITIRDMVPEVSI